jgi:hypothetical protein
VLANSGPVFDNLLQNNNFRVTHTDADQSERVCCCLPFSSIHFDNCCSTSQFRIGSYRSYTPTLCRYTRVIITQVHHQNVRKFASKFFCRILKLVARSCHYCRLLFCCSIGIWRTTGGIINLDKRICVRAWPADPINFMANITRHTLVVVCLIVTLVLTRSVDYDLMVSSMTFHHWCLFTACLTIWYRPTDRSSYQTLHSDLPDFLVDRTQNDIPWGHEK